MAKEINWQRVGYESRIDVMADDLPAFVAAMLESIDDDAARASPERWMIVCKFFAGCAAAAKVQGRTPGEGAERIVQSLATEFPCDAGGSNAGFDEFMDWLANPQTFRPTRLRLLLEES